MPFPLPIPKGGVPRDANGYDTRRNGSGSSSTTLVSGSGSTREIVEVVVATDANITLSAPQTIQSVSVVAGDYVLVRSQTTGSQNGVYRVRAGAWARISTDPADWTRVQARKGTYAGSIWLLLTTEPITLGTTSLAFVKVGGAGGSGTTNRVAMWSGTDVLDDSRIQISGALGMIQIPWDAADTVNTLFVGDVTSDRTAIGAASNITSGAVISGANQSSGIGVQGTSATGIGVDGQASGIGGVGVHGWSSFGIGVEGEGDTQGVRGFSLDGIGVNAESETGIALHAEATDQLGVSALITRTVSYAGFVGAVPSVCGIEQLATGHAGVALDVLQEGEDEAVRVVGTDPDADDLVLLSAVNEDSSLLNIYNGATVANVATVYVRTLNGAANGHTIHAVQEGAGTAVYASAAGTGRALDARQTNTASTALAAYILQDGIADGLQAVMTNAGADNTMAALYGDGGDDANGVIAIADGGYGVKAISNYVGVRSDGLAVGVEAFGGSFGVWGEGDIGVYAHSPLGAGGIGVWGDCSLGMGVMATTVDGTAIYAEVDSTGGPGSVVADFHHKAGAGATVTLHLRNDSVATNAYALDVEGRLKVKTIIDRNGGAPTGTAAAAAGAGATVGVGGSNLGGKITLTSGGAGRVAGTQATITFNTAGTGNGYNAAPRTIILTAANAAAAPIAVYVPAGTLTATTFDLAITGAPLAATTAYEWYYIVIGG